jgi:TetR/AcrR family transcriptional regulator, regulator of cefoperazone and chloramphenicol sensitivity
MSAIDADKLARESRSLAGDGTRERLIEAGLGLFAAQGLAGVRTRLLAEKAGVNQSAIPYYFGGKEGVYAAVIASIADELGAALDATGLLAAEASARAARDKIACAAALRAVMRAFTLAILSPGRAVERTMLIVREQLAPTENFDLLFKRFIAPLHQTIGTLVAGLQARRPDEPIIVTQAHALVGQALVFVVARQAFLQRMGYQKIDQAEAERIAEVVAAMALAAVGAPSA